MVFDNEPVGCHLIFPQGTTGQLKGAIALTAMEMVMMLLSGSLVQRPQGWMSDPFQPALLDEDLEVPIDRRRIEGLHEFAAVFKDLIHSQRPVVLPKDLRYGRPLCCVTPQRPYLPHLAYRPTAFLLQLILQ